MFAVRVKYSVHNGEYFNPNKNINSLCISMEKNKVVTSIQIQFSERWPLTPMAVGSNRSAAVDCLP